MIHTNQSSRRFIYKPIVQIFTCNGRYTGSRTETSYCLGQCFSKIWELFNGTTLPPTEPGLVGLGCGPDIYTSNKYHNYFDEHKKRKITSLWPTFA